MRLDDLKLESIFKDRILGSIAKGEPKIVIAVICGIKQYPLTLGFYFEPLAQLV